MKKIITKNCIEYHLLDVVFVRYRAIKLTHPSIDMAGTYHCKVRRKHGELKTQIQNKTKQVDLNYLVSFLFSHLYPV